MTRYNKKAIGFLFWLILLLVVLVDHKPSELDTLNYSTPGNTCDKICYCCELGNWPELPDDVTPCPYPPFEREMDAYKRMTYGELKR